MGVLVELKGGARSRRASDTSVGKCSGVNVISFDDAASVGGKNNWGSYTEGGIQSKKFKIKIKIPLLSSLCSA